MKVLVTGGAGYIGSILTSMLLKRGHEVKCMDRLFFGKEPLDNIISNPRLELIRDDIRWFDPKILKDVDATIDLASLANDPAGELDPSRTYAINYRGRVRVANLSKKCGVRRYILASTCSVYGFHEGILDETSKPNPLTTYAKSNVLAEKKTLALADEDFTVTALRQATVYGLSPRMRFDLAVNGMVLGVYKNRKIPIMKDGTQWRPFIHVKDTSKAFIKVLETQENTVNRQIFNVGSNEQNVQILSLAEVIRKTLPVPFEIEWYGSPDKRSYRVSFDKIKKVLGFVPDCSPKEGAKEVYEALKNGKVTDSLKTNTVEWYKHLLGAHKLLEEIILRDTVL